ncbi:TetR/AcrR family transcriptional regulator [Corynebacterium caspium]|uniref:TetR/AcrR family transcriptional regulator n=1 Tax=Corynebacterium caspium TaxID=234828 RepID=UPI00036E1586|nr:TetR/AcrR family transcriptional regulator [Corynebacterium caspium]WKD59635.1 division inhibitor protein [Corynebacterium caspium DSM 44850]
MPQLPNKANRKEMTTRTRILDSAAELFSSHSYAQTSTHQIADNIGMRQASLYYYFPSKIAILETLLKYFTDTAMKLSKYLETRPDISVEQKLWTLVAGIARLLLACRWNVGRIYYLANDTNDDPEFTNAVAIRDELKTAFERLAAQIVGQWDPRTLLPFHLVMAITEMHPNSGTIPRMLRDSSLPKQAKMLADATLDLLHAPLPEDREEVALELIRQADEVN